VTEPSFDLGYFDAAYRNYARQNSERKLRHYLDTIERHAPGDRLDLLDVGCGLGLFAGRAGARPGWEVTGVDVDPSVIDQNRLRYPGVEFVVGSAIDLGLSGREFDVVTAWDVIEHITDRDAARQAIREKLRPGGLLFMVVPVYDGVTGPVIRLLDKDETHVHQVSRQDWIDWMSGPFNVLDWHGIYRYLLPGGLYLHVPTRRLRRQAPAILVVAQRG
jgi:ubiquinone/menaquinone biosynthesis C-methylase UbiE